MDNTDLQEIMEILENMEDETLAAQLLSQLNERSSRLGQLVLNTDPNLSHEEWKEQCDQAEDDVNEIIERIKNA